MSHGGKRTGAGRKAGAVSKLSKKAREAAAQTGELPHEFLLRMSRGETIDGDKPSLALRLDAAKAAAPYFAPKLASQEIHVEAKTIDMDPDRFKVIVQQLLNDSRI